MVVASLGSKKSKTYGTLNTLNYPLTCLIRSKRMIARKERIVSEGVRGNVSRGDQKEETDHTVLMNMIAGHKVFNLLN
jgi:hypothetical protein